MTTISVFRALAPGLLALLALAGCSSDSGNSEPAPLPPALNVSQALAQAAAASGQ